jgi:hypothetical protein
MAQDDGIIERARRSWDAVRVGTPSRGEEQFLAADGR